MNAIHEGILLLMKSAVTGESYALPEGFLMDEAYEVIKRHNIVSLAYDGAVKCGVAKDLPVMQEMFRTYLRILMHSEGQMRAIDEVCRAFDASGIDYMPLKGCNLKNMYPKPELRQMGDADILIKKEQYDIIRPQMQKMGFTEVMESDHELVWKRKDLYLELHKHLIPSYNKDYYAYFGNGWRLAKKAEGTRYILAPEDEFIFIFTHFAKHYRDAGAGCRYVLDLWVYKRKHPGMDEAYITGELEKLQLKDFYENIMRLMKVWFEGAMPDEKSEFITGFILEGGTWGCREYRNLASEVKNANSTGSAKRGKVKTVLQAFFPSAQAISGLFPVLRKAPWLLPLFWPVRWVSTLLFRPENVRRRSRELRENTSDVVSAYHESLRYVGLDFNFK